MYCPNCKNQMIDHGNENICPQCGTKFYKGCVNQGYGQGHNAPPQPQKSTTIDSASLGYGLLGFLIPIVGLILYLIWKDEYPQRAKSVGKGALVAAILYAVSVAITLIIALIFTGAMIAIT